MNKILYVIGFYPNNPRNLKMIKQLKKEYEVKCCFWNISNSIISDEDKEEFILTQKKVENKFFKLLKLYSFYRYIKKVVKKYKPDCIFTYHWDIFILTKLALIFDKNTKIVYDISDIPGYSGIVHKVIKWIEELFIDKNIYLMFASPYFQEKYTKFKNNKKVTINNKPEIEFKKIYLENKVKTDDIVISFFGVFRDIEVFRNIFLAVENLPVKLKLYGSGFEKKIIEEDSKKFKNIFIGSEFKAEELPYLYNDVEIILSLYSNKDENTRLAIGNKFFESLVLEKVGLFPKETKMGNYIFKNKLGYVVDPYDKDEIKEAFLSIIENDQLNRKIKKNLSKLKEEELFYEYEANNFLLKLKKFIEEKC